MSYETHEVEWVVATLAPWAVSPHPNFKETTLAGFSELALVTEYRDNRELERYERDSVLEGEEWRRELVDAARGSLFAETQQTSTVALWGLAGNGDLPSGARVASALYGSLGLTELEQPDIAARRLMVLFEELAGGAGPQKHSPSSRLGIAAILQQRVARLEDACSFAAAREAVELVLAWLPPEGEPYADDFRVSQGISWSASTVQADVAASLRDHALASKSHLEQLFGDTWIRVVKNRRGWVDQKLASRAAERDAMMLRDSYEKFFESTSGTRYLMREAASEKGYSALLVAELSGYGAQIRSSREALGKIVLLEQPGDPATVREAVRLLRQSRATKSLQSALKWVRDQGPSAALKTDAELVIRRASESRWITEADLSVLEAAADFLSDDVLSSAISAAFLFEKTEQLSRRADWAVLEKMWKTIARLVANSGEDDAVARRAAAQLADDKLLAEPLVGTLTRVVEAINWELVSPEVREIWRAWIVNVGDAESDVQPLRRISSSLVLGSRPGVSSFQGIEQVAFLADNGLPPGEPRDVVDAASSTIVSLLRSEAAAAKKGALSFGGLSTSNVAAAFAFRFADVGVWMELAEFLTDPAIDAVLKGQALDRLASNPQDVPGPVVRSLKSHWDAVINGSRQDHFIGPEPLPVFAAAVRLGGALQIMTPAESMRAVLRLAAFGDPAKIEAARTVPYVLFTGDPTWGHALLLQLAQDANPEVRAEAGHSLVLSLRQSSPISSSVAERIRELISSEGVRVPLRILHGVQRVAREQREVVEFLQQQIAEISTEGHPRIVRLAAKEAMFRISHER